MNNLQIENQSGMLIKISKGLVIAFIMTLISIFIFSAILTYTNLSEDIVPVVVIILIFISILIGTIVSMRKISKNGMLNGAIVGGIYVMALYLISSILNTGFSINMHTIIMIIAGVISGMVGGIIAINT